MSKPKHAKELIRPPAWTESVLNSASDLLILFDHELHYLYVNEPATKTIGRPPSQILGHSFWEIYPDLVGTELENQFRRTLAERVSRLFTFYRQADGTTWEICFDPVPEGLAVFARDITKRTQAEETVHEYQKAIEGLEEMIVVVDKQRRYVLANRAFLHYRDMKREQVIGHLVAEVIGQEAYETIVKKKLDECFQGKVVKYEMKFAHAHLGARDLSLSYFPVEGPSGIDRAACIFQDITDRKRAAAEVRELSGRLLRLQDDERRRIARDLHDSTGQDLVALETNLSLLRGLLPTNDRKLRKLAMQCHQLADQCAREVRTLSYLLHPPMLAESGLPDAIRHFLIGFKARTEIQVELDVTAGFERMKDDVELALFKVVQESLTNIRKHSGSPQATIRLGRSAEQVVVEVSDIGQSVSGESAETSMEIPFPVGVGISSMKERVKFVGGHLEIVSTTAGTTVRATISASRAITRRRS